MTDPLNVTGWGGGGGGGGGGGRKGGMFPHFFDWRGGGEGNGMFVLST